MGDRIDRIVAGVQALFHDLSVDVREERVTRYVVMELHGGRPFDELMADPYVVNHTSAEDRLRILESPDILREIEDRIAAEFHDYRRQIAYGDGVAE
ncbi:MAG TPA: hypothetical protein VFD74_07610 [Thermoleophilia bacterium]|nr:hypothetical protein [Thermoleophilia bacterium]